MPVLAFIFLLLFLGNTLTTSLVIQQKLTEKIEKISEKILPANNLKEKEGEKKNE